MQADGAETPGAVDEPASVSFLLESRLKDLCFNPHRVEPLRFEAEELGTRIAIASANPADSSRAGHDNLECHASCVLSCSSEQARFVDGITNGIYIPLADSPVALPVRVRGEERIDADGHVLKGMRVPFDLYPTGVQQLWCKAFERLTHTQERFIRLLRWNQGVDGPPRLYDWGPTLYWRVGPGEDHHAALGPTQASDHEWDGAGGIQWAPRHRASALALWQQGATEPLGHELLREARLLAQTGSSRSALLMAATAVEAGVKEQIGRVRPHTSWILQNLPSPPIHMLLRKYLPEVYAEASAIADWGALKSLWNACQQMFEARNGTAHTGGTPTPTTVGTHLQTANDVLYLLDVLEGHDWARERVSPSTRRLLGWPEPEDRTPSAKFMPDVWTVDATA